MNKIKQAHNMLNLIFRTREDIFKEYSIHCGLTPVACWSLYTVYYGEKEYTQNNLSEMWCFPKQTVNSAIKKLVNMDLLYLEKITNKKNSKAIKLTNKGLKICEELMKPLIEAELAALSEFTEKELATYIKLAKKHTNSIKKEVEKLYQDYNINFNLIKKL